MKKSEEGLTCLDVLENVESQMLIVQDLNEIMVESCFECDTNSLQETEAKRKLTTSKALTLAIGEILSNQLQIIKACINKEYKKGGN